MLTIGDVLAATLLVLGTALTTLSAFVLVGLLFPVRAEAAAQRVESRPWATMTSGVLVALPALALATVLGAIPSPVARALSLVVVVLLLVVAVVGASGLAKLAANRAEAANSRLSSLGGLVLGSTLLVLAALIPLVGWFVVAPIGLLTSLGAGVHALKPSSGRVPKAAPEAS